MRFKIDENLPESVKVLLVDCGHDCHSVYDEGIEGGADNDLIDICSRERRHLLTLDLDFADIITYPPDDYYGIVVLRLSRQDAAFVGARLGAMVGALEALELPGHLVIVDDTRIRYR